MEKFTRNLLKAVDKARRFPTNTCPYSRHAQMIGEQLAREKPYPMLQEDPEHCGGSILATVLALYESRTKIEALEAELKRVTNTSGKLDANKSQQSWYCHRCAVEVYQLRCQHCGKTKREQR